MMNEQPEKTAYTVQTKSMLARLMATENIKVEHHSNRKTAGFDLKNRILHCPVWKDMSADLYDLLMGHEISHALRTPADGWHDSITYAGGDKKASKKEQNSFKHFLNVVEDARIEKLLKRQYPGIRRPMILGYKDLLARDFFGLSAISDYNDLYLIDKLNLAAKCGSALNIHFTAKEKPYYNKLMALETWNDVLFLSRELYAYSKTEQKEGEEKKKELKRHLEEEAEKERQEEEESEGEEGEGEWEESEGEWEESDGEEEEGEEEEADSFSDDSGDEDGEESKSSDGDDSEDEDGDESKDGKDSDADGDDAKDDKEKKADDRTTEKSKDKGKGERKDSDKKEAGKGKSNPSDGTGQAQSPDSEEEFVPQSRTDESFRKNEEKLIDTGDMESVYINIPTPNMKDIVTPASIVNKGLSGFYGRNACRVTGTRLLAEFKQKNEDYVMLLAKEFEMKKAARSYKLAKISDSGDININKLANYRLEDNIFKRLMIVNKGKSHGLVLILDKSGSMSPHVVSAMEQILVLALFCRKVNIPFVAYSFCNSSGRAHVHDFPKRNSNNPLKQFSQKPGELALADLDFREMLNSKMQAAEFNQAMMNHLILADGLSHGSDGVPSHEHMGSTPLNESLVVLRDVLRNFKMVHRLDIVNAVIVHDGDSDGNTCMYADAKDRWSSYGNRKSFDLFRNRVTIQDAKERLQISVPRASNGLTTALLNWIQMTTNCGVFGFYITGHTTKQIRTPLHKLYRNKQGVTLGPEPRYTTTHATEKMILVDGLCREVMEKKFLESYSEGYTRFFFIPGASELKIEGGVLEETGKTWTPSRLLSAFKKVNKKKIVSRVLVNRFIELMAVK